MVVGVPGALGARVFLQRGRSQDRGLVQIPGHSMEAVTALGTVMSIQIVEVLYLNSLTYHT